MGSPRPDPSTSHPPDERASEARGNESLHATSLIPTGGSFEGLVVFRDRACIEGSHRGPVRGRGVLEIAAGARVEGEIESDCVVVGGKVQGSIRARERVCLEGTGAVLGDVCAPTLEVADGGVMDGDCLTGEEARQAR